MWTSKKAYGIFFSPKMSKHWLALLHGYNIPEQINMVNNEKQQQKQ